MKTVEIKIPDGYEVDKEKSTFERIVFKEVQKELPNTWEELRWITGFKVIDHNGIAEKKCATYKFDSHIFATKEQAKASVAMAQLSQLMKVYNGDWVDSGNRYNMYFVENEIKIYKNYNVHRFLRFKDEETAELFLENFKDLIEIAKPLL